MKGSSRQYIWAFSLYRCPKRKYKQCKAKRRFSKAEKVKKGGVDFFEEHVCTLAMRDPSLGPPGLLLLIFHDWNEIDENEENEG